MRHERTSETLTQSAELKRFFLGIITVLLITTVLPHTNLLPKMVSYLLAIVMYAVFTASAVYFGFTTVQAPKYAIITLGTIWLLFISHLLASPATGMTTDLFVRVPTLVLVTALNVFFLPRVISLRQFFYIINRLSAVLVVIGLPTLFIGSYQILIIDITPWNSVFHPLFAPNVSIHPLTSIFRNPNTMSFLAMIGTLAAVSEWCDDRTPVRISLIAINCVGLYFAHGRASILGAIVGFLVLAAFSHFGPRVTIALGALGSIIAVWVLSVSAHLVPGPDAVKQLQLSGRRQLWRGALEAIARQPLVGYGPGDTGATIAPFVEGKYTGYNPHNSYLRVFVDSGLIGGFAYLAFLVLALVDRYWVRVDASSGFLCAAATAILTVQMFESFSLFGLSILSVISSVTFGYIVKPLPDSV